MRFKVLDFLLINLFIQLLTSLEVIARCVEREIELKGQDESYHSQLSKVFNIGTLLVESYHSQLSKVFHTSIWSAMEIFFFQSAAH